MLAASVENRPRQLQQHSVPENLQQAVGVEGIVHQSDRLKCLSRFRRFTYRSPKVPYRFSRKIDSKFGLLGCGGNGFD